MECGVPFCHNGCPLGNLIPDWNDLVYRDRWQDAIRQLHATNNFPEFTGRLCPAPCEASCVLEINEGDAVTIKQIENSIIDRAWAEGWVKPQPPAVETGMSVAVVGAGPAGMAAAQQLRRAGHAVVLFERDEAAGGLVRFGVPEFKIEKATVERRVAAARRPRGSRSATASTSGATSRRTSCARSSTRSCCARARASRATCRCPGRELDGIHFAMDYLYERQRAVDGGREAGSICAAGKHVIVIGGGDTGADCVANATREGAASVVQLELLPEPPPRRPDDRTPWPLWPAKFRLSYAMEEARALGKGVQSFSVVTTHFAPGDDGSVGALHYAHAQDAPPFGPVEGTEDSMPAQLVLLAMGFLHPEQELVDGLGLAKDARNNISAPVYETSEQGVFAAGDARRGQSLIVWAINEGRQAARMADRYLRSLAPLAGRVGQRARRGLRARGPAAARQRRACRRGIAATLGIPCCC